MKRKPKSNREKIEAELDRVCSQLTIKRDGCCQVGTCGSTQALAAHHCFGRRNMSVRYDLDNLVTLCWPHHRNFAHGNPLGFANWFRDRVGDSFYIALSLRAGFICKRTEFDLLCLLDERKKQLAGGQI